MIWGVCFYTLSQICLSFPGAEISKNVIKYYSLLNIILLTALCILFFQTFWLWKQKQSCRHIKNNLIAFLGGPLNIEVDWKTKILTQIQAKHNFASTVHSSKVVRFKIGHDLTTSKCNRWWPCLFIFSSDTAGCVHWTASASLMSFEPATPELNLICNNKCYSLLISAVN